MRTNTRTMSMANMARKASDQDIGAGIILPTSANFTSAPKENQSSPRNLLARDQRGPPYKRFYGCVRKSGSSNPNWQVIHSSLFRTISYIIAHSVTQHSEISLWGTLTLRLGVTVVDAAPTLRRSYLGGLKEWYIHERRSWIHKGCRDLDFGRKQSPMLYTQRQLLSATT